MDERAYVAAASAAERAGCEALYAAACAAAAAAGAPAPFRGPAADSPLGEHVLDVIALASAHGFALDVLPARFVCGLTFRLGARRADGSLDRTGFLGGTADMIYCSRRLQAPWLEAARRANRDEGGHTSLMLAAEAGNEQRVRELLAAGAPAGGVNHFDGGWWTALHFAAYQGDVRIVVALADAYPDSIRRESEHQETPLMLACDSGSEGAARALLALGAYRNELSRALHHAANGSLVDMLCEAGAEVSGPDQYGVTPLMSATKHFREDAVRALLARGARQEPQGRRFYGDGKTALHFAVERAAHDIVELLCASPGAATALALRDDRGLTPLELAVQRGHAACAAVLRAHA